MKTKIWYEKYRPKSLTELILKKRYKKLFRQWIKDKEIPHVIFHGPPGSGKTTIAKILIQYCAGRSLILSASAEDRGVETIKKRVQQFASAAKIKGRLNVCFFDEAEGITKDAQEALKTPIEKYQGNCRFIFTTNAIDRLDSAIVSRCQLFEFDSYPVENLTEKIFNILKEERIKYKEKEIKQVIKTYYPDVRTVMNTIQSCSIGGKFKLEGLTTTDTKMIDTYIKKGKLFAIRNLFNGRNDFVWLYRHLFNNFIPQHVPKKEAADAAITVAEYMYRNSSVVDKEINVSACIVELMGHFNVEIDFTEPF